jgi:hypothetical protein
MHGYGLNAGFLGYGSDFGTVAIVFIPARTNFQCYRNGYCAHNRMQNFPNQRRILQERRSGLAFANLFRRATHIDINDLGAPCDTKPCRER